MFGGVVNHWRDACDVHASRSDFRIIGMRIVVVLASLVGIHDVAMLASEGIQGEALSDAD